MAMQTAHSMTGGHTINDKPLPSLPSPTLTNPDMVLPHDFSDPPPVSSPPRQPWANRPPSPSYLRDRAKEGPGAGPVAAKKEKLGLMSRKMMLLRSRTASNGGLQTQGGADQHQYSPRSMDYERTSEDYTAPSLRDAGNLAPESPGQTTGKRVSTGEESFTSEDMVGMPEFLARQRTTESVTDGGFDTASQTTTTRYGNSGDVADELDEERRLQQEEEQNSAILSKRAEHILANAKKRLNLMEGNLRGARDLVTPLTAANLKRATSLGSSAVSPASNHGAKGRLARDTYRYDPSTQQMTRVLHTQASSPAINGLHTSGHMRGFSETEIPERPYTAMEKTESPIRAYGRIPVKAQDPSWTNTLRGSRSYDSIGNGLAPVPNERACSKGSPDPTLEPLVEDDDGASNYVSARNSLALTDQDGLSSNGRSPSRTDDLKGQLNSLKGRISTLKERAREDSLKRRSMQNLREPSPLNNASVTAPEFFYTSSQSHGGAPVHTNAGVGHSSQGASPVSPKNAGKPWEPGHTATGSRNAFAEQAQMMDHGQGQESEDGSEDLYPADPQEVFSHKRTPSGSAIVESSRQRYSHHERNNSRNKPGALNDDGSSIRNENARPKTPRSGEQTYADALSPKRRADTVAHEDRDDAFDYENFFLHSAMSNYRDDSDGSGSDSSSGDSASSVETARGPAAEDYIGPGHQPPPTPETPQRLREIERNLHRRTLSDESVSTVATFATADEGSDDGTPFSPAPQPTPLARPDPTTSPSFSRPLTALPAHARHPSSPAPSRADSGLALPNRSASSHELRRPPRKSSLTTRKPPALAHSPSAPFLNSPLSPPLSPPPATPQDPVAVAVNALLDPNGKALGLRDKAAVFGVVDALRRVVGGLQGVEEGAYGGKAFRRRLEGGRSGLEGEGEGEAGI